MPIKRLFSLVLLFFCSASVALGQSYPLSKKVSTNTIALSEAMPEFATIVLANYQEDDQDKFLTNKMRLQIVAGKYRDALVSIELIRQLRISKGDEQANTAYLVYEIFADSKIQQASKSITFETAFKNAFRENYGQLDDRTAANVQWIFDASLPRAESDLQLAADKASAQGKANLVDALDLVRRYQFVMVYSQILPLVDTVMAEDEARRYHIEKGILITMPDGTKNEALLVRPNSAKGPLTTLLGFTIYANADWSLSDAKTAASYGYAGVVAYTRGKGLGTGPIIPFEHDGEDAASVINWISKQPWSDSKVGMYGNSYNSFTQWSAAKQLPSALKAIMTSGSTAPGIDVPMQGNIYQNFMYPWPFYTTNNKSLDDSTYDDQNRWDNLYKSWYKTGQSYREMASIDGTPNPVFLHWLEHPDYDAYWQKMIPYRDEFAKINIPVLAVTGYFDGARVGVLYYYDQHTRYNSKADHTLVIGPFSHLSINRGVDRTIDGYEVDPVAQVDLQALRYEWFNYVFKGAPKPDLLQDRVNYQVMGGNEWKHSATIQTMSNNALRFYLQPANQINENRLVSEKPIKKTFLTQRIDFADRSDADWTPPLLALTKTLDAHNGIVYISEPMKEGLEVSGLFTGKLDFITNKRDVDLAVTLYEKMENGDYFQLSYHLGRASYSKDRTHRQLLQPGKMQQIDFRSERLVSRKLQSGSRLVVVVSVLKQSDMQINYGTGKNVSDETIADSEEPLTIKWYNNSYVEVPIWLENIISHQ